MAVRRQQQWEAQLKEKGFPIGTIKPIVDEAVAYKAPVPYALCEAKRTMDKGIHFRNTTRTDWPEWRETRIRRLCTCTGGRTGAECERMGLRIAAPSSSALHRLCLLTV